ncbi:MAG: orotidine-5'-phosphate decarboxylase [Oscillospiraceae bacterium]|nr:orotidine-5'-phosphate decarboxylase [Oscillospiraceae bacterium]
MSFDRLQEKINIMKNPTVVGLDPALDNIPPDLLARHLDEKGETLQAAADAVLEYNMGLIDALWDIVPAVKPQAAFHEILGPEGVMTLKKTCEYAKSKGMYVICDAKRNDIGTTAVAYSAAFLGTVKIGETLLRPFDVDALTINAYLGSDGVIPFIEEAVKNDKAVFTLVKTSNPSSGDFQDKLIEGEERLYTTVADLMDNISKETIGKYGFSRVGAVVGATYPQEMVFLRARLKNTFFLVPGYGAQGGGVADVAHAFNDKGQGAIVNSSRGIIAAWKESGEDYTIAARKAALAMKEELASCI